MESMSPNQVVLNQVVYLAFGLIGISAAGMVLSLPLAVSRALVHHDYKLLKKVVVGLLCITTFSYIIFVLWVTAGLSLSH